MKKKHSTYMLKKNEIHKLLHLDIFVKMWRMKNERERERKTMLYAVWCLLLHIGTILQVQPKWKSWNKKQQKLTATYAMALKEWSELSGIEAVQKKDSTMLKSQRNYHIPLHVFIVACFVSSAQNGFVFVVVVIIMILHSFFSL